MDRKIIYPGQIPLETDLLGTNQSTMVALSKLASALFGTSTTAIGLSVGPSSPAALTVLVGPGEVYALQSLEATAYSSLPADTTHSIVKQGILLDSVTLSCPAPTTAGFSINYLIEATFQEVDDTATVLPFYNASNPSQAYSGPNNTGASSTTRRAGTVVLQAKAGIAATTGTQTTPAPDAGYIALAVVTVANGQSTIVAGNIVSTGQALSTPIKSGRLLKTTIMTATGTFTSLANTAYLEVEGVGGGGAGGGATVTTSTQISMGSGGASGSYAKAQITSGFSGGVTVTIGASGAINVGAAGGSGGTTSFGAILTIPGGGGGGINTVASTSTALSFSNQGLPGAVPTTGAGVTLLVASAGQPGPPGLGVGNQGLSGQGASSVWCGGGVSNAGAPGNLARAPGAGGSGGFNGISGGTAWAGGLGGAGILVIREYS